MNARYATFQSILGPIQISYDEEAVIGICWKAGKEKDLGTQTELTRMAQQQLEEYFSGKRKNFSFPYKIAGSEFQQTVWNALLTIPYGETRTYQDIARRIGAPKAARAVGMANRKNPLMIVIPCHRVLGAAGGLTGYAGGLEIKSKIISMERNGWIQNKAFVS